MKVLPFVVSSNVFNLKENDGRESIYRVVKKSAFSMIVEKMASYPSELVA